MPAEVTKTSAIAGRAGSESSIAGDGATSRSGCSRQSHAEARIAVDLWALVIPRQRDDVPLVDRAEIDLRDQTSGGIVYRRTVVCGWKDRRPLTASIPEPSSDFEKTSTIARVADAPELPSACERFYLPPSMSSLTAATAFI
jgi:hypothetical protein